MCFVPHGLIVQSNTNHVVQRKAHPTEDLHGQPGTEGFLPGEWKSREVSRGTVSPRDEERKQTLQMKSVTEAK